MTDLKVVEFKPKPKAEEAEAAAWEAEKASMITFIEKGLIEAIKKGEVHAVAFATVPTPGNAARTYFSDTVDQVPTQMIGVLDFLKTRLSLLAVAELTRFEAVNVEEDESE